MEVTKGDQKQEQEQDPATLSAGLISLSAGRTLLPTDHVAMARAKVLGEAYRGAMAPFRNIILSSSSREECLQKLAAAYVDWQPERLATELETALQMCAATEQKS